MTISQKQLEYVVEVSKIAGLGITSAFAADWVFGEGLPLRDFLGVSFGIAALLLGFWLTKDLEDDKLR
ncbi:MAG: hypothetical protein HYT87_16040 [Nitrospirae bacterium]|nr:hypothetical protein [Nitrospirota bacterium]